MIHIFWASYCSFSEPMPLLKHSTQDLRTVRRSPQGVSLLLHAAQRHFLSPTETSTANAYVNDSLTTPVH